MGASANPNMVANPYQRASMANMGAMQTFANPGAAAAGLMNPYENQVVQATMRDVGQQALQAQNTLGAQAQAAGAFGGSRHGIAEAEMAKVLTWINSQLSKENSEGYLRMLTPTKEEDTGTVTLNQAP